MVWLPPSSGASDVGGQSGDPGEVPWMGRRRASMATNSLLAKAQLGKPRPTTFVSPDPGHVFGIKMPPDAEGAKQVTLMWKQHQPNPHAKPGPDFKAMNRLAADNGLTGTRGVRAFREAHAVAVKCGAAALASKAPPLPSKKDPRFAYGKPKGYRSAEDRRNCGPSDPPALALVQGAYAHEWVDMNAARADELDARHGYIKPATTKAAQGHARGAAATAAAVAAARGAPEGGWKMGRFLRTAPRVTAYMGGGATAAAAAAGGDEGERWEGAHSAGCGEGGDC
ncbi:MAG: flagellar associated protein [Monoraphidium minutum]|nr:MAG: flagellar associated protein [Monoraphidium minutum]